MVVAEESSSFKVKLHVRMSPDMQLIVFSGLPGTGKSSLAEAVGRRLGMPVFSKDVLEAAIIRAGMTEHEDARQQLGWAGYELLTTLATRQLRLGQSAILDSVASTPSIRNAWRALAHTQGAVWRVIECVCSDEEMHRSRLENRKRNIHGWRSSSWEEVERVRGYFTPWQEEHLTVDAMATFGENIDSVLQYLSAEHAFAK
jgi:predicted kinase